MRQFIVFVINLLAGVWIVLVACAWCIWSNIEYSKMYNNKYRLFCLIHTDFKNAEYKIITVHETYSSKYIFCHFARMAYSIIYNFSWDRTAEQQNEC